MPKKQPKPDANQLVAALVNAATDSEPVRGEDLIGDPDTRRKFLEAKQQEGRRQKKRRPARVV